MKADWINPFIRASTSVLSQVADLHDARIGRISLEQTHYTSAAVTAMLGVNGMLQGTVLIGLTRESAEQLVERMSGVRVPIEDELSESAFGELANMICGSALAHLEDERYTCQITPPVVIYGLGTVIATTPHARLVVPIEFGPLEIRLSVSLQEA